MFSLYEIHLPLRKNSGSLDLTLVLHRDDNPEITDTTTLYQI